MEQVKILGKPAVIMGDYDEEADVLYLSIGEPQPVVGVDLGDGVVLRYDEAHKEVVGITLIGLRTRLLRELAGKDYCSLHKHLNQLGPKGPEHQVRSAFRPTREFSPLLKGQ